MGQIIEFNRRGRPARARLPAASPGQIVIFTGVRYERSGPMRPNPVGPNPVAPEPAKPRRTRG